MPIVFFLDVNVERGLETKKTESVMATKDIFIKGAGQKGISEKATGDMFFELMNFSAYAFIKSHSVAYTLIGWQQVYLKSHYPEEFVRIGKNNALHNRQVF